MRSRGLLETGAAYGARSSPPLKPNCAANGKQNCASQGQAPFTPERRPCILRRIPSTALGYARVAADQRNFFLLLDTRPMTETKAPASNQAETKALLSCDIVMAGGVTSGIIYPGAVAKIAERYSFHCIGGTSVGAIAAAATAAAEYGRRTGVTQRLLPRSQDCRRNSPNGPVATLGCSIFSPPRATRAATREDCSRW